jgi:ubiquinone biosynthesis protein UbiJ
MMDQLVHVFAKELVLAFETQELDAAMIAEGAANIHIDAENSLCCRIQDQAEPFSAFNQRPV